MAEEKAQEYIFKIMDLFSQTAKIYTNISVAALMLPITFIRQVLGIGEKDPIKASLDYYMICSWGFFLLAIGSGLLYQYLAVKFIESKMEKKQNVSWFVANPGYIYGIMLGAFFIGALLFTLGAYHRLK